MQTFKTPKGTELPILDMRGKPYLQVAHRLVWFREERPMWRIQTELKVCEPTVTVAKATVMDDAGNIMATAHKREDQKGFQDHMEKAETGAVGRALAMVGYGTQFCADELSEGQRLADSPVAPARANPQAPMSINNPSGIKPAGIAPPAVRKDTFGAPPKSTNTFGSFDRFNQMSFEKDVP